jgi:hypothetical protein
MFIGKVGDGIWIVQCPIYFNTPYDTCAGSVYTLVCLDATCHSKSAEEPLDYLRKVLATLRENTLFIKMVKIFWAKRETEYLGFIVGSGIVRLSQSKFTVVKN